MNLAMHWTGEPDFDRVAETRSLCYGHAAKDLPKYHESLRADRRAVDGDFLLAELAGRPVGTATSLSMQMWIRGARVPCQGVAWVGTIKTHRRGGRAGAGVASQVMRETLRRGRERGQVVTALMPFRGSFYERFGYGVVERHCAWTIPLAVLPAGDFDGIGFYTPADRLALADCRQRQVQAGQCDIERNAGGWNLYLKKWEDGMLAVDRTSDGAVRGYLAFQHLQKNDKDIVHVTEVAYDDLDSLKRLLCFLATLRDQYSAVSIVLPPDLPANWMLRETQIPHRLVNHPHARTRVYTRMSVRILDHQRLLESMRFPSEISQKVVIAVRECDADASRFELDISQGRASAAATEKSADFECADRVWAAIVCGELAAGDAVRMGLAEQRSAGFGLALDGFARGPKPFCQEYF